MLWTQVVLSAWLGDGSFGGEVSSPPLTIVGGSEAEVCQFPATVVTLEGDETPSMCSGTLVHPELVMTAAHCIMEDRPIVGLGFGETALSDNMPTRIVEPIECVRHPGYDQFGAPDLGWCRLAEAVTDVPIVPMMSGCELELLEPGVDVTIVGFGSSYAWFDDFGELQYEGGGIKRWVAQSIYEIIDRVGAAGLSGGNSQSACFGDSGGSAYVQLEDGTWRVFGVASQLFDPGGQPTPVPEDNVCGTGATYTIAGLELEWYESSTGLSLGVCTDGEDFTACQAPTSPNVAAGTWDNGCQGGTIVGAQDACAPVGGTTGDDTSGGESSGESSGTGSATTDATTAAGSSSGIALDEGTSADASSTTSVGNNDSESGPITPQATGSDATSEAASDPDDSGGCGCRSAGPRGGWFALGLLLTLRRRRSPRPTQGGGRNVERTRLDRSM